MITLSFYDHARQPYAHVPIDDAAEFMVGDYGQDGSGTLGEFRITLVELPTGAPSRRGLAPKLHVFGDGTKALQAAVAAGLFGALGWCDSADEFAERLIALGFDDKSEFAIGSAPARCSTCSATARLVDGVTTCECGSTEFRYEERVDSWREQERNADGMLSFKWDPYNIDGGDDTPGVLCLGCRRPVDLPDGVLAWDGARA